jgi:hypothetical protein
MCILWGTNWGFISQKTAVSKNIINGCCRIFTLCFSLSCQFLLATTYHLPNYVKKGGQNNECILKRCNSIPDHVDFPQRSLLNVCGGRCDNVRLYTRIVQYCCMLILFPYLNCSSEQTESTSGKPYSNIWATCSIWYLAIAAASLYVT